MNWKQKLLEDKFSFRESINSVCVIGAAKSGLAAAKLALKVGKTVYLSDNGNIDDDLLFDLESLGVKVETGGHSKEFIAQAECVIISPGVATDQFSEKFLSEKQIFVGELEFAYWYLATSDIVAITGTNGKTTTTTVSADILGQHLDRPVYCLGNIGTPLSDSVLDIEDNAIVCLELSSFQLETVVSFKAHVAVLLNVTPDHYDRYDGFDGYYRAKRNIFINQLGTDHIITIEGLKESCAGTLAQTHFLSSPDNSEFVKYIAQIYGLDDLVVDEYWNNFKGLEHRREYVDTINGVRYVNDSKATNVEATIWALKSEKGAKILLAGGKDKGFDFLGLVSYLTDVKKIIAFGECAPKIEKQLGNFVVVEQVRDLVEAVKYAHGVAEEGDTVLLSPMCSSFDQFKNYMQRGYVFREQVYKLRG